MTGCWTTGANAPIAKMTIWNEAMYYFHFAPSEYRKVLFVPPRQESEVGESLFSYYQRTYKHLIPEGVEILQWDHGTEEIVKI